MNYTNNYIEELKEFNHSIDIEFLKNKSILISGATGLIGSYLIDSILINSDFNVKIWCLTTNKSKAIERFIKFYNDDRLIFIECDLTKRLNLNESKFDYIIHLASFSDPSNYRTFPVETMLMNINGCNNLLNIAKNANVKKFLLASSCEIYGTETENLKETNVGSVNTLDIRSCYNESKRASETLCVSYTHEYNVPTTIARLSRIYGPTMLIKDSKALSQFIKNSLNNEDIVLKSKGEQIFTYCYVSDAVNALFYLLNSDENAQAYNITNSQDLLTLKEIAEYIAKLNNKKVVFELPKEEERLGYSRATKSVLITDKIENLGWKPQINLYHGIKKTFNHLKEMYYSKE